MSLKKRIGICNLAILISYIMLVAISLTNVVLTIFVSPVLGVLITALCFAKDDYIEQQYHYELENNFRKYSDEFWG